MCVSDTNKELQTKNMELTETVNRLKGAFYHNNMLAAENF